MRLDLRRAAITGLIMPPILAASTAATSPTPLPTFLTAFTVAVAFALVTLGALVLVDRRGRRRSER